MASLPLKVLVVDDSAVVRHTVGNLLRNQEEWTVSAAPDPIVALDRIRRSPPDVILLDLEMPRMDGLTFLRHLMATDPVPVVVCSGFAGHGSDAALEALEAGAVEIYPKPRLAVKEFLEDSGDSLMTVLRHAAAAAGSLRRAWRPERRGNLPALLAQDESPSGPRREPRLTVRSPTRDRVVLIAASTGGPDAIRRILSEFPANGPACVIIQHMAEPFIEAYTRRLDAACAMTVRPATAGARLTRGTALVAPGGRHLIVRTDPTDGPVVDCTDAPPVRGHRPSADVLFESAARELGAGAVGVVLTGMGNDGAEGLLALREVGAPTLAQDEATSAVFGMPGAALARGGAARAVPLPRLATALLAVALAPTAAQREAVA